MLAALAVALSLASPAALEVPFVPQTEALCGGAAAAMVFRYWGDARAGAQQFATLVERRANGVTGIANDVLVRAIRTRGWRTESVDAAAQPDDALRALRSRIDARQPVIVLLAERGNQFHYVVVTGWTGDAVILHDPSWGPFRRMRVRDFTRLWQASRFWSLIVLPPETGIPATTDDGARKLAPPRVDPCDESLDRAVQEVRSRGIETADAALGPLIERCPASAGPLRELAGVRFIQRRWREASHYASRAVDRDANDEYALYVLGASQFMQDDSIGGLRAWNRIGKPKLDVVRIEGLRYARYQAITDALGLQSGAMLTPGAFAQAKRRLADLPNGSSARIAVRPQEDDSAAVDVGMVERSLPRGTLDWVGTGVHAAVEREVAVGLPGFTGQGEAWSASWRWWNNRPRVALTFAAPRVGALPGVLTIDGSWEAETFALAGAERREERKHVGVSLSDWPVASLRYEVRTGFDAWADSRRAAAIGGAVERRWFDDRLRARTDMTLWAPVSSATNARFTAAGAGVSAATSAVPRPWLLLAAAGIDRVSDSAPLGLWPGAGEGRARPFLLRAHPLLDDGVVVTDERAAFGRTLRHASIEGQRWLSKPALVKVGVAAFADVARASRLQNGRNGLTQTDVGLGLRIRVPGAGGTLRVDAAHGLRDGADAFTVGWTF